MNDDVILKKGDIKVDSDDLISIFSILESYQDIVHNGVVPEEKTLGEYINYINTLKMKYLLIPHYRRMEHLWFQILKIIDNKNYEICNENISLKEECFIEDYMELLKGIIKNEQELYDNIKIHIGVMIKIFGIDVVRREIWGCYLDSKKERELLKKASSP